MPITSAAISGALLAVIAAVTLAATPAVSYRGSTSQHGAVSFKLLGALVTTFRFVNACPADSDAGTLVPASIPVKSGRFSYRDGQFTIAGQLTSVGASGTARDQTGDCDSTTLHWRATRR